ncbi:MAG TPA: nucleotidyltransferase domain-containing protein [Acidimicrobiales bacterium]|nr:nucleotidyltransferase domain-containing protein [Acidimicrobiales bacterium]
MNSLVERRHTDVARLCHRFHVRRLELFGSAARADFDPSASDLDFLVEFEDLEPVACADACFGLLESLQDLVGRAVDLVVPSAVRNPDLLEAIARGRVTLYSV